MRVFLSLCLSLLLCSLLSVSGSFSSSDRQGVLSVLSSTRSASGAWANNQATLAATQAYKAIGNQIPDAAKLCAPLQTAFTQAVKAKNFADIHATAAASLNAGCKLTQSADVKAALQAGLNDKDVEDIYHAASAAFALSDKKSLHDFDWSQVIPNLVDLLEDDGSFRSSPDDEEGSAYHAGLALQTIGTVFSKLPEHEDAHRDAVRSSSDKVSALLKLGLENENNVVDFSAGAPLDISPLEAAAAVVQGVQALSKALSEQLEVSQEDINRLSAYFLENKYVGDVDDAAALTAGLSFLADNNIFVPLFASVTQADKKALKVRVTNINDEFATKLSVTLVSALAKGSKSSLVKDVALTANGDKAVEFELSANPALANAEPGVYTLKFKLSPSAGGKDERFKTQSPSVQVKFTASISGFLADVSFSESARGTESDVVYKLKYPQPLPTGKAIVGDATKWLHVKINFFEKFQPASVFVQIARNTQSALFVAKPQDGNYVLKLNLGSSEFLESIEGSSGEYVVRILVGDELLPVLLNWSLGSVTLNLPQSNKVKSDAIFAVKPTFFHQFRAAEVRPPTIIALVFTGLVALPFVVLLISVLASGLKLSLPSNPSEFLYSFIFQTSILAILLLYVLYWFSLNIFQALAGLAVIGLVAVFSGTGALKALHQRNAAAAKKQE